MAVRASPCRVTLVLVLCLLVCAGCGQEKEEGRRAPPQTIRLGWHELDGVRGIGFELEVRTLRIAEDGWAVDASVTNRAGVTYRITRPHVRGGTKFGLFILQSDSREEWNERIAARRLTPELLATRFSPSLPPLLRPGGRWNGTFDGPGRPPAGTYVRIAFGRFVTTEAPARGSPRSCSRSRAGPREFAGDAQGRRGDQTADRSPARSSSAAAPATNQDVTSTSPGLRPRSEPSCS